MPTLSYKDATLVASADWSCNPRKCWVAVAARQSDGSFRLDAPFPVRDSHSLLSELRKFHLQPGAFLVGFDFPIGIPGQYAARVDVSSFLELLPVLGKGEWEHFFKVASEPGEISLYRPFYPQSPGHSKREHLTEKLGLDWKALYRQCDRSPGSRPPASTLFWTMGAKQVGKAALHGWKNVLQPAIEEPLSRVNLWPFSGSLAALLQPGVTVIAEIYPTEYYTRLGVKPGKRSPEVRQQNALKLCDWAQRRNLVPDPDLAVQMRQGFPEKIGGDDAFDAVAGLLGMLDALMQPSEAIEPEGDQVRKIEGWILGQDPKINTESRTS